MGSVQIRAVEPRDIGFLADMLREAVAWRTGEAEAVRNRLGEPQLARYFDGWGRPGDRGVVAIDESGRRAGAAWYRLFALDDRGYGSWTNTLRRSRSRWNHLRGEGASAKP
jgi:hypothetical protein